jgi:hypothetical protein
VRSRARPRARAGAGSRRSRRLTPGRLPPLNRSTPQLPRRGSPFHT